jgi:hypothetical protein
MSSIALVTEEARQRSTGGDPFGLASEAALHRKGPNLRSGPLSITETTAGRSLLFLSFRSLHHRLAMKLNVARRTTNVDRTFTGAKNPRLVDGRSLFTLIFPAVALALESFSAAMTARLRTDPR